MIDSKNMREVLKNFHEQLHVALELSERMPIPGGRCDKIVIAGMGGSAIAGDILRAYVEKECKVPVEVIRDYNAPRYINRNTLAFISSYSGNTEETLSIYKEIKKFTKKIICITSNGKLQELGTKFTLIIPGGLQPRCALGYLFMPLLVTLYRKKLIPKKRDEINETISLIREMSEELDSSSGLAYELALKLKDRFIVIYSSRRWEPIARRFATQLNENSKLFAHYNVFPEMNHNEIVGFGEPPLPYSVVYLRTGDEHARIIHRIQITKGIIERYANWYEVKARGKSTLAKIFSLIYTCDYTSYWLALARKVDPTPIERIDYLKKRLADSKW